MVRQGDGNLDLDRSRSGSFTATLITDLLQYLVGNSAIAAQTR